MGQRVRAAVLGAVVVAAALGAMPGCLINSHSSTSISGRYISDSSLDRVEVGKTKQDFVKATLGEPTCRSTLDDGSEVWRWDYKKTTSGNGTVFLLFSGDNHNEKQGSTYVMFKDGVVSEKWRD